MHLYICVWRLLLNTPDITYDSCISELCRDSLYQAGTSTLWAFLLAKVGADASWSHGLPWFRGFFGSLCHILSTCSRFVYRGLDCLDTNISSRDPLQPGASHLFRPLVQMVSGGWCLRHAIAEACPSGNAQLLKIPWFSDFEDSILQKSLYSSSSCIVSTVTREHLLV